MVNKNILTILYKTIRKLAKCNKYQTLYNQHKESGVSLFVNKNDYTDFQIAFLQYLQFYSNLHMDIYMDEVGEIVLEDEVYEDAYSYYNRKTKKKKNRERNRKMAPVNKKSNVMQKETTSKTHIVFRKPKIKNRR